MMDERKISVVIPTWCRYKQTIDSFKDVLDDERVHGVYITDDASEDGSYDMLKAYFSGNGKVHLFKNEINKDCYANKNQAMRNAEGDWCIILDSDNHIDRGYLDALYSIDNWDRGTIYQPQFSRPYFDFRNFSGLTITKENVKKYINTTLETALNTFNFFINRDEYLNVWDGEVNPGSSDSIYFNLCWMRNDGKILITPNLEYNHYISTKNDGHYQTNSRKYIEFHKQVLKEINNL